MGGCRALGWVRGPRGIKGWPNLCVAAPMKSWEVVERDTGGHWEHVGKLLLLLNNGGVRDLRQNDA